MARSPLGKFANIMVKVAKFFAKLAIYFVIMYFVGGVLFNQGYKLFYEYAVDPNDETQIEFTVSDSDTLEMVANKLYDDGLIDNKRTFKFMALIYNEKFKILKMPMIIFFEQGKDNKIYTPGTYMLSRSMTQKNIIDTLDDSDSSLVSSTMETTSSNEDYQLSPEGEEEDSE